MLRMAFLALLLQMSNMDVFLSKFGKVELDDLNCNAAFRALRYLGGLV
jgi:hypothetical protein